MRRISVVSQHSQELSAAPAHRRIAGWLVLLPILVVSVALAGCGGAGSGVSTPSAVSPTITAQPAPQSAYVDGTATFSVTASGTDPLTYQWLRNGTTITGANSSSYTTGKLALTDAGALFSATVSNSAGSVTSSTAKLSVSVQAPTITASPTAQTVTDGGTATFSVAAAGTPPLSYQWQRNGSDISGATASSYTLLVTYPNDNGVEFDVVVSNAAGSVKSSQVALTVNPAAVSIVTQPAGATVFAGEPATFSVTANGTGPLTYQWRKNSASISGATSKTYTTPALASTDDGSTYDVEVTNPAGSVTSADATVKVGPFQTSYTTQKGAVMQLYAWPGRKNAFLTQQKNLDPKVMRKILNAADNTWDYYAGIVGKNPGLYFNYQGLATIAVTGVGGVDLCGDGCTYIGATGMEISNNAFSWLYNGVVNDDAYDQVIFYEFGRSFWLFPNVQYASPDDSSCEITGYAVLGRYLSIQAEGLTGSFGGTTANYTNQYNDTLPMIDQYAADSSLNFKNTFLVNTFSSPHGGCSDLWTSMMLRLRQNYGGEAFIQGVFHEMVNAPAPVTTQDAVDNFVLAVCAGAKTNLTYTLGTAWKFPISTAAAATAQSKWGSPQ